MTDLEYKAVDDFQKCHSRSLQHAAAKETLMKIIHSLQKK